jgi:hypothetical protein
VSDVVVTVPKRLWLDWIYEGDAVGDPATGQEWGFFMGGPIPSIVAGERVYIVAHGRLRGYAPLTRIMRTERGFALCRQAGAVAVTIQEPIPGFRGWRRRWWDYDVEMPFPRWAYDGVVAETREDKQCLVALQRRVEGP